MFFWLIINKGNIGPFMKRVDAQAHYRKLLAEKADIREAFVWKGDNNGPTHFDFTIC